jgi:mono/diheme cytochrome c family protein
MKQPGNPWRRRGAAALVATAAAVALPACGEDASPAPATTATASAPATVAREIPAGPHRWDYARARFREMCAGCHTLADARATGPRYNLDRIPDLSEEHVRFAILEGEPGMPAWEDVLSPREYEEIAEYVFAVARREEGETNWKWQFRLRDEGHEWQPGELR